MNRPAQWTPVAAGDRRRGWDEGSAGSVVVEDWGWPPVADDTPTVTAGSARGEPDATVDWDLGDDADAACGATDCGCAVDGDASSGAWAAAGADRAADLNVRTRHDLRVEPEAYEALLARVARLGNQLRVLRVAPPRRALAGLPYLRPAPLPRDLAVPQLPSGGPTDAVPRARGRCGP